MAELTELGQILFNELIRNGHSRSDGKKTWDIARRQFLYLTPELAKGFLNMKRMERYKVNVRARETNLIKRNGAKFSSIVGNEPFNLIDVGCGDGNKAKMFIKGLNRTQKLRYCPVNVNSYLVNLALENVKKQGFDNVNEHKPCIANFDSLDEISKELKSKIYRKNVFLVLGSILAGYEINDYLFRLTNGMRKGDYLIIGNGVRTGKRLVNLKTYKNKAFDQWFIHLMKGLGFDKGEVKYDARFGNSRVDMFYRVNVDKTIEQDGKKIKFRKGDEILVAILYKYYAKELEEFCKMYFGKVEVLTDKEEGYALALCQK